MCPLSPFEGAGDHMTLAQTADFSGHRIQGLITSDLLKNLWFTNYKLKRLFVSI